MGNGPLQRSIAWLNPPAGRMMTQISRTRGGGAPGREHDHAETLVAHPYDIPPPGHSPHLSILRVENRKKNVDIRAVHRKI